MLSPANGFYQTPGLGRQEVRLAYVINRTDLAAASLLRACATGISRPH